MTLRRLAHVRRGAVPAASASDYRKWVQRLG